MNMGLTTIAREILVCTRCDLHKARQRAVPGEGPDRATIMLVGEAPGRVEDLRGKPFVGRSGKILDRVLKTAGIRRQELFITSVVKCRPPQNRTPRKAEWQACVEAHLWRQIRVIDPAIICLLGGVAARALLGIDRLSQARGQIIRRAKKVFFSTYHPAAVGRNPSWFSAFSEDMQRLQVLTLLK